MNMLCFPEDAVQGCLWLLLPFSCQFSKLSNPALFLQCCKLPGAEAVKSSNSCWSLKSSKGGWSCPLQNCCVRVLLCLSKDASLWCLLQVECLGDSRYHASANIGILVILHALHSFVPAHSKNVHVCALFRFSSSSAAFFPDKWRCFTL